jgi:hypothetical protein
MVVTYLTNHRFYQSPGYAIKVASSSTLSISNTCFVNDYYAQTPLDKSGDPVSACQYIFKEEAYKCFAPESNVCGLPACAASYKLYNATSNTVFANIVNGGTITSPPCDLNIEAVLPCSTSGKKVTIQLLNQLGAVIKEKNRTSPFFLYTMNRANALDGKLKSGKYTIQAVANGVVQPSPQTFTLAGSCL